MIETRAAGTTVSRHIVMAIGNRVVRLNSPPLIKANEESLELTKDLARCVTGLRVRARQGKNSRLNNPF